MRTKYQHVVIEISDENPWHVEVREVTTSAERATKVARDIMHELAGGFPWNKCVLSDGDVWYYDGDKGVKITKIRVR